MKAIDIGKQGAERLDDLAMPKPEAVVDDRLAALVKYIKQAPLVRHEVDTSDGIKRTIDMRCIPLGGARFTLAHELAAYEPLVFLKPASRERAVMGMLSANYSSEGDVRLEALKLLPLRVPQPLTPGFSPPAEAMVMLSGAVSAERKGVGSHDRSAASDLEHRATILGAVSLDKPGIALEHQNHAVRQDSAVATGLSNGRLGNLYTPGKELDTFQGYGEPVVIGREQASDNDRLYIPESFLDNPEAYGTTFDDAPRIMLGAGLQVLHNRGLSGGVRKLNEAMG